MQTADERIHYLLDRLFRNECTEPEKSELAQWIEKSQNNEALRFHLGEIWKSFLPLEDMPEARAEELTLSIIRSGQVAEPYTGKKSRTITMPLFRIAAAVFVLLAAAGIYSLLWKGRVNLPQTASTTKSSHVINDIAPGKARAVLTLSDGSEIILDTAGNTIIAKQGNSRVTNKNGQLSYNILPKETTAFLYNTLTTQKGEQYHLTLSDGTNVWLNAASSIRFPVTFSGNHRDVEITGEAYFEVTHNKAMPFRVRSGNQMVEVLGTHFNINSYEDEEELRTTLIEGSVKINVDSSTALLYPNQQAVISKRNTGIRVLPADGQDAIAWKNGLFKLHNSSIGVIMRQIARWYNLEITYEGTTPTGTISGEVPRNLNLSEVLKVLEISGVRCRLEGRLLTIVH